MDSKVTGEDDGPSLSTLKELLDNLECTMKAQNSPSFTYLRGDPAMASIPADVKNLPDAYLFIIDLPGIGLGGVKVELEDSSVLVISAERMREEHAEDEKYLMMERWMGKLTVKFKLPVNSNTDAVSAVGKNGVLTVTVQKLPLSESMANELKIARGFRFSNVICSIWGISVVVLLVGLLFGLFRPTNLQ